MITALHRLLILSVILLAACHRPEKQQVLIFHAGSLSYPMREMAKAFMHENPDINIVSEAAGSVHSARKITDLNRRADIMGSADYQLINSMLIPNHTGFNILFASNSMVIAFKEHSLYANEINPNNWIDILQRPAVNIGSSDPNADPCGYRTQLLLQLASRLYGHDELASTLLTGDNHYQRPKETDLLALVETRTIDYLFIYESMAVQHGLPYVKLPDSINLSQPKLNDWYATAQFDIRGNSINETITVTGEAIVYGICILHDAPNPDAAELFLDWVLNPQKGGKILQNSGQQPISPALVFGYDKLPASLKQHTTDISTSNNTN
jgi:molybdate/tungstate transport system substrate-binding protein